MRNGIVSITSLQNPYKDKKITAPWRNLAEIILIKVPNLILHATAQIEIVYFVIESNEKNTASLV